MVITVALTPAASKLIGEKELGANKLTVYHINAARGEIVGEESLDDFPRQHWIDGAGPNDLAIEPLTPRSKLWELHTLIISPPVGGKVANYDALATA